MDVTVSVAGMDIDLLIALDALLVERNVTKAAERIGISQPALSARLTRLRGLLDDRLFVASPNGRGVLPTPRASALAPAVTSVLGQITTMLQPTLFDPVTSNRLFTIAMHENPAAMLGPDLVQRIGAVAPHLRIRLALPDKEKMPALLEEGVVDIFVGVRAGADNGWIGRTLFEDQFLIAQRKGHPRGDTPLDLDAFCQAQHLLVSAEGDPFTGFVDRALAEIGRQRTVSLSVQSYATAPLIVANTDLVCTLPQRLLQQFENLLDLFPAPIRIDPIQVTAYWHLRHQEDPAHQWLRKQLFAAATIAKRR